MLRHARSGSLVDQAVAVGTGRRRRPGRRDRDRQRREAAAGPRQFLARHDDLLARRGLDEFRWDRVVAVAFTQRSGLLLRSRPCQAVDRGGGRERADDDREVVSLRPERIDHVGEEKGPPRLLGEAADELPAHERVQLGVLVDRPVDPHEQAALLEARDMLLKIDSNSRRFDCLINTCIGGGRRPRRPLPPYRISYSGAQSPHASTGLRGARGKASRRSKGELEDAARVSALHLALPVRHAGRSANSATCARYSRHRHVMKQLDASEFKAIGQPLRRKEDLRLLTGKGRFTDDFSPEGQAYAVMVRCPHPHARIRAIDDAAARALPGVLGVFTGQDCIADGLNPIPHEPVPKTKYDMKLKPPSGKGGFLGPHMLLPADKARHVGEAVVMVVAETEEQALDAAEAVQIDYDELPFVTDGRAALSPALRPCGTRCPAIASSIRCSETPRRPTAPSRRRTTSSRWISTSAASRP